MMDKVQKLNNPNSLSGSKIQKTQFHCRRVYFACHYSHIYVAAEVNNLKPVLLRQHSETKNGYHVKLMQDIAPSAVIDSQLPV
jgi:hypothetical protein